MIYLSRNLLNLVQKDMAWAQVKELQPPLYKYVLVKLQEGIGITRWMGDRFDIKPDGKMPYFKETLRTNSLEQPEEWQELPE